MPETTENYHHIPVRDASDFVKDSFRYKTISEEKGIMIRLGKLKSDPDGPTVTQAYLFDVDKWTIEEAKAWVKEHMKMTDFKAVPDSYWSAFAEDLTHDPMQDLVSIHRRFHMSAAQGAVPEGMTKADLARAHNLVVEELRRRYKEENPDKPYEHDSPLTASDIRKSLDDEALKCGAWNKLMAKLKKLRGKSFHTGVKSLGDGRVGGYLMVWGGPGHKDLEGDYFTPKTELCLDWFEARPILYDHGHDGAIKLAPIGTLETKNMRADDLGLWIEGQLDIRSRYLEAVEKLIEAGVLGWSSRTLPDLMQKQFDGQITRWPVIEATMTTHPAELRYTDVQALKAVFEEAGLELPKQIIERAPGGAEAGASGQAKGVELRQRRAKALEMGFEIGDKGE